MIKFGIVGTNWITEEFIRCASKLQDFTLNAVYSRTEEKALEFAGKYSVENTFTDLEEMAKSDLIDAVYIASPNSFHEKQALIFLNNKKHVLCEKPIASNLLEVSNMINAARKNDVLLMEALKTTFLPNFKVIKDNIHKIGKVRRYYANYCQYSSRYDLFKEGKNPNTFNPKFSNGALMDIGIYCVYPLISIFGIPNSVTCNAIKLESGVDGQGHLFMNYEDMDAVIIYSKISNSYLPTEIQGEKGTMIIDKIHTPEKVEIVYRSGEREDLSLPQSKDSMYYEAEEFIDLIKSGQTESRINSFKLSYDVMSILEVARQEIGVGFPADSKNI